MTNLPEQTMAGLSRPVAPEDFGELITARKESVVLWVLAAIVTVMGIGLAVGGISLLFSPDQWIGLGVLGIACALLALGAVIVLGALRRTEFRETGVVVCRGSRVLVAMPYDLCERFWYQLSRNYVNGIYVGTSLALTFKSKGRRSIKWSGRHKEKPKGFAFTILGKNFKGEDELDVVKLIIADAMADRWIDRLLAGESIAWGKLTLDATTATPKRGKRKGQRIPFADIDRLSVNQGWLHLFHKGEDRSFFTIQMNDENFWPGMRVIERMWHTVAVDETGETIAG